MSATADISRYRDYFKDLGRGERVEVLAIPCSNQHSNFQRKVMYLEQVRGQHHSSWICCTNLLMQSCVLIQPSDSSVCMLLMQQ